jgi:hypothetical protein
LTSSWYGTTCLTVAAVMCAAGVGKLLRGSARRELGLTFTLLTGLPGGRLVAVVLPVAEAVVGIATVVPASAPTGLFGALALLVIFSGTIWQSRRKGRLVACRCFGGAGSGLGAWHLTRNVLLMAAVVVAIAGGPPDGYPWTGHLAADTLLAAAATLVFVRGGELVHAVRAAKAESLSPRARRG